MKSPSLPRARSDRFVWWATAVLLIAAVMRLVALQDLPPGLAQDEVLNADVALFIREGRHALFFREGYGHEPLYHYWSVPFQVLLGDNFLSIRLPAVVLGLLLVAATMRWARREFGTRVALVAGFFLAISWWPIIFSRIGIRPILEPLLLVAFAWFWPRRPVWAGFFLGLSLYSYTAARVLFLLPLLLGLYAFFWRGASAEAPSERAPRRVQAALIVLGMAVLVSLPLWLTLQADPTLQQRVNQLGGPLEALQAGDPRPVLETTLATLGVFSFTGDPRWTYSWPDRPLFDPLAALFFYGGLLLSLLRFRRPSYAFLLIWLAVGLLPSAVTPQAPSTVRLVGAMPPIYIMPALAVDWVWQQLAARANRRAAFVAGGLTAVLLAITLGLTVRSGFLRWPQALETRLKYQTVLLDMARARAAEPGGALVVSDAFYRPITADSLRRNAGGALSARWAQTGSEVAGAVIFPAEGGGVVYVPEFAAPAGPLAAAAALDREPLWRSAHAPSFAAYTLPQTPDVPLLNRPVTFGGQITLLGYTSEGNELLTLWRVEDALPADLAAFVHLLDPSGSLVAQHDGFDAAPATLQPGDLVLQRHVLAPPNPLDTAAAELRVGLYRRDSGGRLLRNDGEGDYVALPADALSAVAQ